MSVVSAFLPYVVAGVVTGSVYGLAGTGLVLTFRTSGVFNFAHGALGTLGAYLFYELWVKAGIPWPISILLCLAIVGVGVGGGLVELLARRLTRATAAVVVVTTVGLLLAIEGSVAERYGSQTFTIDRYLPTGTFDIGSTAVSYDQLIVVLIGVVVSAGLSLLLSRTRLGVAMRGVVDDADLMELTGFDKTKVRRIAWMIGGSVAVLSGVLLAPVVGLDPLYLTFLVVSAFGAAAIGRFRNLPATFVGGIVLGIGGSIASKYAGKHTWLLGVPTSLPFIALFVVLVVVGRRGLPAPIPQRQVQKARLTPLPRPALGAGAIVLAVAVLLVPQLVGTKLPVYTNALGLTIMFLSLGLLVKSAGQVSLCHAAFVAVGAVGFSRLAVNAHVPWLLAVLGAGLIAIPVGVLVALPAIRLSGIYLALATFGFGYLLQNLVYRTSLMFGKGNVLTAPRPHGLSGDKQYYYVALAVMAVAVVAVVVLQRSRLGRLVRANSDSPLALSTFGTSTTTTLVLLFALSAFFAGISGAVIATGNGAAGSSGLDSLASLTWVAVIAITGSQLVRSSILAAILLAVVPAYLPSSASNYLTVGFGLAAMGASLYVASDLDLIGWLRNDAAETVRLTTRSRSTARAADRYQLRAPRHEERYDQLVISGGTS
jgi:branched-subunit amino acid ABC-type transport system permease component